MSETSETLSEAQKLNTTGDKTTATRRGLPYVPSESPVEYKCTWCQTIFSSISDPKTGAQFLYKCAGGCPQHYLCSKVCQQADWRNGGEGHAKTCLRGRGVNVNEKLIK
jgi:hypothetical protein